MKKIFAIAWKDAIIRFASSSELLFFIVLPLVFTFLLAGGTPSGDEDPRIGLVVVDEAQTAISKELIGELESSTAVRPEVVTREEAESLFEERRADVVFIIPAGIDLDSLQRGSAEVELLQQPNNMNATIAERARSITSATVDDMGTGYVCLRALSELSATGPAPASRRGRRLPAPVHESRPAHGSRSPFEALLAEEEVVQRAQEVAQPGQLVGEDRARVDSPPLQRRRQLVDSNANLERAGSRLLRGARPRRRCGQPLPAPAPVRVLPAGARGPRRHPPHRGALTRGGRRMRSHQ